MAVVAVIIPGIFLVQAHASQPPEKVAKDRTMDNFVKTLDDTLLDRVLTMLPFQQADLDDTTLGKTSQLSAPARGGVMPGFPRQTNVGPAAARSRLVPFAAATKEASAPPIATDVSHLDSRAASKNISPANADVRAWIADWRKSQAQPAAEGMDAKTWIANWRTSQAQAAAGTFSAAAEDKQPDIEARQADVRQWIADWRTSHAQSAAEDTKPPAAQDTQVDVEARQADIRQWIANWRAKEAQEANQAAAEVPLPVPASSETLKDGIKVKTLSDGQKLFIFDEAK